MDVGRHRSICSKVLPLAGLLTILGVLPTAYAQESLEPTYNFKKPKEECVADGTRVPEDERLEERETSERRLRKARIEEASRHVEAGRKIEATQARGQAFNRLEAGISTLGQRESYLHHEVRSVQAELQAASRDPADHSAVARRGELEHRLLRLQIELDQTTMSKQSSMRQLDGLRLR